MQLSKKVDPDKLKHWIESTSELDLIGTALVGKSDVLPHWTTHHIPTDEMKTMTVGEPLVFPPQQFPVGAVVMIYYPKD